MSDGTVDTVPHWRTLVACQRPEWPDQARLDEVVADLAASPPLVTPQECDPRLNAGQALELAVLVAEMLRSTL